MKLRTFSLLQVQSWALLLCFKTYTFELFHFYDKFTNRLELRIPKTMFLVSSEHPTYPTALYGTKVT